MFEHKHPFKRCHLPVRCCLISCLVLGLLSKLDLCWKSPNCLAEVVLDVQVSSSKWLNTDISSKCDLLFYMISVHRVSRVPYPASEVDMHTAVSIENEYTNDGWF